MQIIEIDSTSKILDDIIKLWRANSKTLGFFPEGAFHEHASHKNIIAVINDTGILKGYLLYRVVRRGKMWPEVTIVHLCIAERFRNQGIGKILIEYLRNKTKQDHLGIGLWCRRDYSAHSFWQKAGFIPIADRYGRSGESLTFWWMDFGRPSLFNQPKDETKVQVVIDTNVFYDLQDDASIKNEESKSLFADWLTDEIILSITDEIYNEIDRNSDPIQREKRRGFANGFQHLQTDPEKVEETFEYLTSAFPLLQEQRHISDGKQIAHTIAGGVNFFITRDHQLVSLAESLYEKFNIKILSPGYFIGQLDEVIREAEYQPTRMAGTAIQGAKIRSSDQQILENNFLNSKSGEKGSAFLKKIKSFISNPNRYDTHIIRDTVGKPLAVIVYDSKSTSELLIPMIRIARHQLAGTILRRMLYEAIFYSAEHKIPLTRITDEFIQDDLNNGLVESGFSQIDTEWVKLNIPFSFEKVELLDYLNKIKFEYPYINKFIAEYANLLSVSKSDDLLNLSEVERTLWPVKILDSQLPTFIIPIKPTWAQHLFDERLANLTFWGADPGTMLRIENVYYRSCAFGGTLRAPARILWYVSAHHDFPNTKCIRACSSLDEVIIGPANSLYKRFNRLGIYRWEQIIDIAGEDPESEIMALRFSHTEQFPNPISLTKIRSFFQIYDVGRKFSLQSPLLVSPQTFVQIYKSGVINYRI
jgi:GNAT superfamily N-acetyltransferase/predicted nucleic acid-binding protein